MIFRDLYNELLVWKASSKSLPLILRGARQVGKTTLIDEFGKTYDQYLYFNLEKTEDAELFVHLDDLKKTVQLLFLARGQKLIKENKVLLFFDEVQERPEIIEALRYFKEDYSHLDIIVSGSLLEFALREISKVPVGRVQYLELHPLNFREFLRGLGNQTAIETLNKLPLDNAMASIFYKLFNEYALVGGMPGILASYISSGKDITTVQYLFASIIESYKQDVEKYASNDQQKMIIRHIMDTAPYEIDNRINLNNFGNSTFKTREIKEAMHALISARILELVYPTTQTAPPIVASFKKRPRLHFLDIGLINYQLGLQQELLTIKALHQSSRGKLIQQIVNQEIKAQEYLPGSKRAFWVKESRGSTAEVDIVYPYQHMLIPIEVKSGSTGTLRSLHEFMDRCDHQFAVRIYGGTLHISDLKTRNNKNYKLLNLPYFLSGWIKPYINWFVNQSK